MTRTLVGTPDQDPDPAERGTPTELLDADRELDRLQGAMNDLRAQLRAEERSS